ncbi:hypothetical protein [Alkalihalobacillus deserti]|uniref:hypothetical protein n=1 Tax=Alkalihalobacillus deserti TaxID=2879466 RepID=UPI001D159684|nr:hypothetical protein [Alkalihalobacillus deserti]
MISIAINQFIEFINLVAYTFFINNEEEVIELSKKTLLLIIYLLSFMFFLRSVFRILIYEGSGGYGMVIVSALVMTFVLRIYLKERRKEKEKLTIASK